MKKQILILTILFLLPTLAFAKTKQTQNKHINQSNKAKTSFVSEDKAKESKKSLSKSAEPKNEDKKETREEIIIDLVSYPGN